LPVAPALVLAAPGLPVFVAARASALVDADTGDLAGLAEVDLAGAGRADADADADFPEAGLADLPGLAATFAEAGLPELTLPDADFAGLARLDFAGLFFAVLKTDLDLGVTATMDATHLPDQKRVAPLHNRTELVALDGSLKVPD